MHWILASLIAAGFRGIYELFTKHAVHDNAVLPVLFLSTAVGALVWAGIIGLHLAGMEWLPQPLVVESITAGQHGLLILKSLIVTISWVATYFAVKHLPVSIVSPIRATMPVWTLGGAMLVLAERPNFIQLSGVAITLGSIFALSIAGRGEGINIWRNRWVGWAVLGMMLAVISTLYDKWLLGSAGLTPAPVQAWFSIYLTMFCAPLALAWKLRLWARQAFHWRWSIVFLSLALLVSDYYYFTALNDKNALVSLIASLRQGSTLVALAGGIAFFHEVPDRRKVLATIGVLVGISVTLAG
ncbi:MAG: DMT family transporter [Verrucomicrobiota bacterium]